MLKPTPREEPLRPLAGAINCVVAARQVGHFADKASLGRATVHTLAGLQRDLGVALMQLVSEEKGGTVEIQLTVAKEENALDALTTHQWRLDVWKARQRNYIRVPVQDSNPADELAVCFTPKQTPRATVTCTHCKIENLAPIPWAKLPIKTAVHCHRCTLPIWIMLVEENKKADK